MFGDLKPCGNDALVMCANKLLWEDAASGDRDEANKCGCGARCGIGHAKQQPCSMTEAQQRRSKEINLCFHVVFCAILR